MRKEDKLSELEYKMDFLCAKLLHVLPEKQERAKEEIKIHMKEYRELTGKIYIPDMQRRKYLEGDY